MKSYEKENIKIRNAKESDLQEIQKFFKTINMEYYPPAFKQLIFFNIKNQVSTSFF